MEVYRQVEDYDNYEISNIGNIRNSITGKILKQKCRKGYKAIDLWKQNTMKTFGVHRLVAIAFLDNPNNKPVVDHIDGDKLNNNVENLRWATLSENKMNSNIYSNNTSGCKGVYFCNSHKRWVARIGVNKKCIHLGYYKKYQDAIKARKEHANRLYGAFIHRIENIKTELELLEEELNNI